MAHPSAAPHHRWFKRPALRPGRRSAWRRTAAGAVLVLTGWLGHATVFAQTPIQPNSTTAPESIEISAIKGGASLKSWWWPGPSASFANAGTDPAPSPRPVVLALHGCGGLYNRSGALADRYRDYAERLQKSGYAVLMPDSWGSRGLGSQCGVRYAARGDLGQQRVADVHTALDWLRHHPQVDATRIALLGWSNGGSTILRTLESARDLVPALAGAAVFYPGCAPQERRQATLAAVPLLIQLGADDDWTPPAPCMALAERLQRLGRDVQLDVYPGSVHGFDGQDPVRFRADVPNGVNARGVMQGGNPAARVSSQQALDTFLQRVFTRRP